MAIAIRYETVVGVPSGPIAEGIVDLASRTLPAPKPVDLAERLAHTKDPWGVVALDGDRVVGFKLGYSDRPGRFYSWLGAVAPSYRRQGIARQLMNLQHAWCRAQGYRRIRTHTTNHHRGMLLLNIHAGFDIVGTTMVPGRPLKLVMERALTPGD